MASPNSPSDTGPEQSTRTTSDPDIAERSQDARERLTNRYHEVEQTVGDTRARIEKFNDQAVGFIQENPGIAIVGAVATGYLIGRLASRRWLA